MWPTILAVAVAAVFDLRTQRIPNWIVGPFLVAGLVAAAAVDGLPGVKASLLGILLAVLIAGPLCYLRGLGMGDLKLLAAVGAWIGPSQLGLAMVVTAVTGGLLAVVYAWRRRSLDRCLQGAGDLILDFPNRGLRPHRTLTLENPEAVRMPYGVAIAFGTIFSFFAR